MPLWLANRIRASNGDTLLPAAWEDVIKHPWQDIGNLPKNIVKRMNQTGRLSASNFKKHRLRSKHDLVVLKKSYTDS